MSIPRRRFLQSLAAAGSVVTVSTAAWGQAWPTRVVRLLVGFAPGGGADSTARIVANRLSEIWGQQVVVENRPGAGGNIALDAAAHASPDGYTLVLATGAPAIHGFLLGSLSYDPVTDLMPVSLIGTYPNLVVVANSSPMTSMSQYIAAAKANPGKHTFASPGVGTSAHLSGELLKHMANIEIVHVPYRGVAAGGMTDLLSGRVDAMFNTTGSLLQAVRSGQVRGLAVTSGERFPTAPTLPTISESGVPGFNVTSWYGIFVPAKTPAAVVAKINADMRMMLGETSLQEKFEPLGVAVAGSTSAELAGRVEGGHATMGPHHQGGQFQRLNIGVMSPSPTTKHLRFGPWLRSG